MRPDLETGQPFRELMARFVDDFADRFGLRAEFACEQDLPRLAPRTEAELLRIAQEALNNVQRHADATFVRVEASVEDGSLVLRVADNGRGFDPEAVGDSVYGLASMRERASLIGASLAVDSRPQDGTRIRVALTLPSALAARGRGA
jgi:signal transduction histidine kinase